MNPERLAESIPALLPDRPGLRLVDVWSVPSGMNSVTLGVTLECGRFVAKWVPSRDREALVAGARTAWTMADAGIRAGAPLELPGGVLTTPLDDGEVTVLHEVRGDPLTADEPDQAAWGAALGRVHAAAPRRRQGAFFGWVMDIGLRATREGWVRRAVAEVAREQAGIGATTWVQLHTDPEPGAFLRDEHGDVGVIDWTGSVPGPALYDVASAVMYAGGTAHATGLLESYRASGALPDAELDHHLDAFRRFRAVVQAVYFSTRVADVDLTGITSQAENDEGLQDARDMLRDLGVAVA